MQNQAALLLAVLTVIDLLLSPASSTVVQGALFKLQCCKLKTGVDP